MVEEVLNQLWSKFTLTPDERANFTVAPPGAAPRLVSRRSVRVIDLRDFEVSEIGESLMGDLRWLSRGGGARGCYS